MLLIVLVVGIISTSIYFYLKNYLPKFRWTENYTFNDDQPYGLKLAYELLKSTHPNNNFIFMNQSLRNFLSKKDTTGLYVFIGAKFICDSAQSELLTDFVKKGNNAFISSIESTHYIFSILSNAERPVVYYTNFEDSIVNISFDTLQHKPQYQFDHKNGKKLSKYNWAGVDSFVFSDTLSLYGYERISNINLELIDCFRIKYGKGWFIFHFNPILFTNYTLSRKSGFHYFNQILSEYNKPVLYWDEFSKIPGINDSDNPTHESPLRFILSDKSLRWAWYLSGFFILLFIAFNAKRKQASIPLLPDNKNTTVEFIHSIASLHYQNNATVFLTEEILKQFLSFVKINYGISPHLEKGEIIRVLAPKSGISETVISDLFKHYVSAKYSPVNEMNDLLEFYRLTEYFYQNCK
jgi:hypothetical protein